MAFGRPPLFPRQSLAPGTYRIGVPIHQGCIGLYIAARNATPSATYALQYTSFGAIDAPTDVAGTAEMWTDSGETITGPSGAGPVAAAVNLSNVRQQRARLVVTVVATTDLEVYDGIQDT